MIILILRSRNNHKKAFTWTRMLVKLVKFNAGLKVGNNSNKNFGIVYGFPPKVEFIELLQLFPLPQKANIQKHLLTQQQQQQHPLNPQISASKLANSQGLFVLLKSHTLMFSIFKVNFDQIIPRPFPALRRVQKSVPGIQIKFYTCVRFGVYVF